VGNTISGNNNGIEIWQNLKAIVRKNIIRANSWIGIKVSGTGTVVENTITHNGRAGESHFKRTGERYGDGVMIFGDENVTLAGNTITQNARYGVYCDLRSHPNLGDLGNDNPDDDGGNIIHSNGHGNIETESIDVIKAEGNFWQETKPDTIARTMNINTKHTLATVDFKPYRLDRFGNRLSEVGDPTLDRLPRTRSSFTLELQLDSKYPTWQSNGQHIPIHKGDRLMFRAVGMIDYNVGSSGNEFDPNGKIGVVADKSALAPGLTQWGVVGWIARKGDPFFIGKEMTMVAPTNGLLHFGFNDWSFGDNSGTCYVTVKVNEK
jgi:hypothetical protein